MTNEDVKGEIDRDPFEPIRLFLASGKTVDARSINDVTLLRNSVLVFLGKPHPTQERRYNLVSLRNIECIERLDEVDPGDIRGRL